MAKYSGWITLFALAGTLSAVMAIAVNEAFISAAVAVLTVGEWELLAAVFYIIAVLLYLSEGHVSRGRGVVGLVRLHRRYNLRGRAIDTTDQHDATYQETLEAAEA